MLDGFDVLTILFTRISVIETKVAQTAEFRREAEIEANGLGMPDVEVTIRLWRKSGLHPAAIFFLLEVLGDDIAYKMRRRGVARCHCRIFFAVRCQLSYH